MTDFKRRLAEIQKRDPDRLTELWADLQQFAATGAALELKTDAEVATLLRAHAEHLAVFSAEGELLLSAAARLDRAAGGVCRECSWCVRPGVHARPDGQWACDEHEASR